LCTDIEDGLAAGTRAGTGTTRIAARDADPIDPAKADGAEATAEVAAADSRT